MQDDSLKGLGITVLLALIGWLIKVLSASIRESQEQKMASKKCEAITNEMKEMSPNAFVKQLANDMSDPKYAVPGKMDVDISTINKLLSDKRREANNSVSSANYEVRTQETNLNGSLNELANATKEAEDYILGKSKTYQRKCMRYVQSIKILCQNASIDPRDFFKSDSPADVRKCLEKLGKKGVKKDALAKVEFQLEEAEEIFGELCKVDSCANNVVKEFKSFKTQDSKNSAMYDIWGIRH